jgi:hypothetical protein
MRGRDHQRGHLGGYVDPEALVPPDHPRRQIRPQVNAALERLSPDFEQIYSLTGRPSIPPEQLLRALLLQAFFTVRSERQLVEQLGYNILMWTAPRVNCQLQHPQRYAVTSVYALRHSARQSGRRTGIGRSVPACRSVSVCLSQHRWLLLLSDRDPFPD